MRKMKIGLIFTNFPSNSETFLISKINGLKKYGHQIILFGNGKMDEKYGHLNLHPKLRENYFYRLIQVITVLLKLIILNPFRTFKFLKLEKIDNISKINRLKNLYLNSHIINSNLDWIHFCFCSTVIRRENVAKAIGAKMSLSIRGYDVAIYPLKHKQCYSKLWNKVDKVHSISNDLLEIATNLGYDSNIQSEIIYPAINTEYFALNNNIKKIDYDNIKFLTVARLHWKKGLEYSLEALSLLKNNGYDFEYTIIGDGPELERLKFATYQLGLEDNIKFKGYIEHASIREYYQNSDIYLQYSIQEGFCNSLLEAQSMGLICIASDADGLSENILDHKTGYIVEKRDPFGLYQKIDFVLNQNKNDLNKIRKNGRDRIVNKFNIELQAQYFNLFFQK